MREMFASEIKFCIRPTAFSRFIRERRESERAEYELFSYENLIVCPDKDVLKPNGNDNGIRKKESPPYKFKPLFTIEDTLFAKGIKKLVFSNGFVYNLTHSEMNATEEDIKRRKEQERKRAEICAKTGARLTPEMAIFAAKQGIPVSLVLFNRTA